jgi:hypothetical protein
MLDPALGSLLVLCIALLLAAAAVHKLRNPAAFAEVFVAYDLIPAAAARRLAWLIPAAELCIALALLWLPLRRMAIFGGVALFAAYGFGLGLNLARGRRDLDCGCAPAGNRRRIAAWMVWRNAVLVGALGAAALPWTPRAWTGADFVTLGGGIAALCTLSAAVDRLLGDVVPKSLRLQGRST